LAGGRALSAVTTPTTYFYSPSLIPKPLDWGPNINVVGNVFLDAPSSFTPPPEVEKFLHGGAQSVARGPWRA
jgi:hypothetical protein